jgi:hypothetical protein
MLWTKASRFCRVLGGHLVCINNAEEQAFVAQMCKGKTVWSGGLGKKGGGWKWDTGQPMEFTNWDERKGSGVVVLLKPNGKWGRSAVEPKHITGFVCEWDY